MTDKQDNSINWALMAPLLFFIFILALFFFGLSSGGDKTKLKSTLIGKAVPDFALPAVLALKDDQGQPVPGFSGKDLRNSGKLTIMNVWASWCVSCRYEHRHLETLAKATGAQIYGFNYKDSVAGAHSFLRQYGNPYAAVGMATGRQGIEWGVHRVPETFIINAKGKVIYKYPGPINEKVIHQIIVPAIAKVTD